MAAQLLLSSSTPPAWTIETIHVAPCKSYIYHTAFVPWFNSDVVEVPSLLLQPVLRSLKERCDVEPLTKWRVRPGWEVTTGADRREYFRDTYRLLVVTGIGYVFFSV
jgi:hypothetical protein